MISWSALLALLMSQINYSNIFILMLLESSVFPVPSELVLIPAGFLVASGILNGPLVFITALTAGLAGSLLSYAFANYIGREGFNRLIHKYGSFVLINESHLIKTEEYFRKHGSITVFTGRLLPVVRHLISFPAGFAKMNLGKFSLYTSAGAGLWAIVLMLIGYILGANSSSIAGYTTILTFAVIIFVAIIIAAYVYLVRNKIIG